MDEFNCALDALSLYEEYDVKPRPRVLQNLASILSANGKPVPFQVPKVYNKTNQLNESTHEKSNTNRHSPVTNDDEVYGIVNT